MPRNLKRPLELPRTLWYCNDCGYLFPSTFQEKWKTVQDVLCQSCDEESEEEDMAVCVDQLSDPPMEYSQHNFTDWVEFTDKSPYGDEQRRWRKCIACGRLEQQMWSPVSRTWKNMGFLQPEN